jgi:hypothetical protein
MPNCVASPISGSTLDFWPACSERLIDPMGESQSNESHDRDPRWRDVSYSRRDPRRFPARAASMNLFPAEGRKSLPRILTKPNVLVNRHLSPVEIGEVLAPAAFG